MITIIIDAVRFKVSNLNSEVAWHAKQYRSLNKIRYTVYITVTMHTYQVRIQDLGKGGSIGIRTRAKRALNSGHTHLGVDHAYF